VDFFLSVIDFSCLSLLGNVTTTIERFCLWFLPHDAVIRIVILSVNLSVHSSDGLSHVFFVTE